jgi:predicted permease
MRTGVASSKSYILRLIPSLDLRYAIRRLLRTPGYSVTALATLAICIGANVAIFAVVDAIVVRSLPFPDANRLVFVYNSYPRAGLARSDTSIPDYFDWRQSIKAFASVSITHYANVVVGGAGSPRLVPIERVTPEYFTTLGLPLAMGRTFTEDQLSPGADNVAILTDRFWRSYFNSDPNVIGRIFLNDGISTTVIGVLPSASLFARSQFYRPASHPIDERQPIHRHSSIWVMIARLAPGATLADAQAQIDALNARQAAEDPRAAFARDSGYHTIVTPLHDELIRNMRPTLILLQCGVLLLLLMGGVNLANLVLIRANGRSKEIAVRQALGASRLQLAADALLENILLASCGGLCGIALGSFGVDLLKTLGVAKLPLGELVSFDGRVVAMAFVCTIVIGLFLALPAVVFNSHTKIAVGLQSESQAGTASPRVQRLRYGFIVAQIALTMVLLSGAGLLAVSLKRVLEAPVGFNPNRILTGNIMLPQRDYKDVASRVSFAERLSSAICALPGVSHAAFNTQLPFNFHGFRNDAFVSVEGGARKSGEPSQTHFISYVIGDFWPALGIPLLRGRLLEPADNHRGDGVCVVDHAFAERYWPGSDPLGHRLSRWGNTFNKDNAFTVVGVVGNVKQRDLTENIGHGAVYFPFAASGAASSDPLALIVSSSLPPASLAPIMRKVIQQLDPNLPIDDLRPMQADIDDSLVARRSPAILASIFAAVALLLATVGTYGVLGYVVAQRQREIGVRMALGADPARIRNQFMAIGLRLLIWGSLAGIVGAWWTSRAMRSVLYDVLAMQGPTLIFAFTIVCAVTILACLVPARRAAMVDPITALRAD